MKKVVGKIGAVIFIVGIFVGPLYLVYCKYWNGSEVGDKLVWDQTVQQLNLGDSGQFRSSGDAKSHGPLVVELSPDMNPLAVIVKAHYPPPMSSFSESTQFDIELYKEKKKIWEETASFTARRKEKKKIPFRLA